MPTRIAYRSGGRFSSAVIDGVVIPADVPETVRAVEQSHRPFKIEFAYLKLLPREYRETHSDITT